jgi:hypothetical protein
MTFMYVILYDTGGVFVSGGRDSMLHLWSTNGMLYICIFICIFIMNMNAYTIFMYVCRCIYPSIYIKYTYTYIYIYIHINIYIYIHIYIYLHICVQCRWLSGHSSGSQGSSQLPEWLKFRFELKNFIEIEHPR